MTSNFASTQMPRADQSWILENGGKGKNEMIIIGLT